MNANTNTVTHYYVYANGIFERQCKTLRGARSSARALARKGNDYVTVAEHHTDAAGVSWCVYLPSSDWM